MIDVLLAILVTANLSAVAFLFLRLKQCEDQIKRTDSALLEVQSCKSAQEARSKHLEQEVDKLQARIANVALRLK